MMLKSRSVAPVSRRCVKVEASSMGLKSQIASAASIGLAAFVLAAPADAGVILTQPKLKKAFQSDGEVAVSKPFEVPNPFSKSSQKAPAAKSESKKAEIESYSSGGIDFRSIALPGALVLVGGLGAVATALDPEFSSFIDKATIRDSSIQGVGYEGSIKSTYTGEGFGFIYPVDPNAPKKKAASKGGFFGKK